MKWSCCTRIGTYFKLFIVLLRCSGRSSRILTAQAFPQAEELRVIPLENLAAFIEITADDYGIVITRGHNFDFIVAKQLLETPAKYIGVMGSKHKIASQVRRLKEVGYTMTEIERIFMPIGLDIAAETPEELAISIAEN